MPWCARESINGPGHLNNRILDRFTSELLEKGGKDGAAPNYLFELYVATSLAVAGFLHARRGRPSEEAGRLGTSMSTVSGGLSEAERKAEELRRSVASIAARCETVEDLEERTRALGPELDQRHHALKQATEDLQQATELRKEAASSAQKRSLPT